MSDLPVPEIDVVIASCLWLGEEGLLLDKCSVAAGQGIDARADRARLINALPSSHLLCPVFEQHGPDIVALSDTHRWYIECKGTGGGKPATQRNHFDRAVASVASYFTDDGVTLGLAVPATPLYRHFIRTRVPPALRKRLHMWLLLHDPTTRQIQDFAPGQGFH